jgi:hypothetical protein
VLQPSASGWRSAGIHPAVHDRVRDGLRQPDGGVHFAGNFMTSLSSFMQGGFNSAREVATAIDLRAVTRS